MHCAIILIGTLLMCVRHTSPIQMRTRLTEFAAQVVGAPGGRAQDVLGVIHRNVVVGAWVVRAERFTALRHCTLFFVAQHLVGVLDRSVAVRAADGVAEQIAAL